MDKKEKKSRRIWMKILIVVAVIFLAVPFVFNLVLDIHSQFLIELFQGYQNKTPMSRDSA